LRQLRLVEPLRGCDRDGDNGSDSGTVGISTPALGEARYRRCHAVEPR